MSDLPDRRRLLDAASRLEFQTFVERVFYTIDPTATLERAPPISRCCATGCNGLQKGRSGVS